MVTIHLVLIRISLSFMWRSETLMVGGGLSSAVWHETRLGLHWSLFILPHPLSVYFPFVIPTSSIPIVSIPTLSLRIPVNVSVPTLSTFQIESMLLLGNQFPLSEASLATFLASLFKNYATEILPLKQHKHLLATLAMLINKASKQINWF